MKTGWIALHRKLQNNPLWFSEPFTKGQAWVDLLLLANHKKGFIYVRGNKITVKRGQVGWSQKRLSGRWQWSRTKVRKFLQDLEEEHQIKQHKNNLTTIITIKKYDEYQPEKQQDGQQKNIKKTSKEQQRDTNKNVNNVKNEKKNSAREDLPLPEKIQQAKTVDELSKIWFSYLEEKKKWPSLSEQEMIQHRMKEWGLNKSKLIVSSAAQNGWKSLKEDYISDHLQEKQQERSPFRPDAIHL